MSTLGPLAEEIGVNERTLRRAVNEGTLRGARRSPRKLDLPLSERTWARSSWTLISQLRATLRTERDVRFALLFGSAARVGGDRAGADVDVLVELRDASLDRVADLEVKLERRIGRPVDLVRLADAETDPAFLAEVIADGRVLVDRDAVWPQLRAREAALRRRGRRRLARRVAAAHEGIDRLLVP
jgi:predicted nucleotidyltransferase